MDCITASAGRRGVKQNKHAILHLRSHQFFASKADSPSQALKGVKLARKQSMNTIISLIHLRFIDRIKRFIYQQESTARQLLTYEPVAWPDVVVPDPRDEKYGKSRVNLFNARNLLFASSISPSSAFLCRRLIPSIPVQKLVIIAVNMSAVNAARDNAAK